MGRRWAIAGLAVVTAVLLGVGLFEGLLETRYGDGGLIEVLAAPVDSTKPFGPLLWVAGLFALLGPLRPWHRTAARIAAGIALLLALVWFSIGAAFTSDLRWPTGEDALVLYVLVIIAAASAAWGFGRSTDEARAAAGES